MTPHSLGAGGHDVIHTPLVLLDVELQHALLVGDLVEPFHVDCPKMLDVDRSPLHKRCGLASGIAFKQYCMHAGILKKQHRVHAVKYMLGNIEKKSAYMKS